MKRVENLTVRLLFSTPCSRSTKFLSDAGKLATGATFVHDSQAEKTSKFSVPLMQVPVHAGWESHLLIRADVRLQTSNTLNVAPLINFDFYNNAGSTITMPLEAKSLLPVRVLPIPNLSRFQTMQRICLIPAGATSMKFTYEQNFAGRVELKNLKVRGPIW